MPVARLPHNHPPGADRPGGPVPVIPPRLGAGPVVERWSSYDCGHRDGTRNEAADRDL